MKVALCDDEGYVLKQLHDHFETYSRKYKIKIDITEFESGNNLIDYMKTKDSFDLIVLDINMKDSNGILIAYEIRKFDDKVRLVFLTHLSKFALEGYKVHAERYLIKPLIYEKFELELHQSIEKILAEQSEYFIEKNDSGVFKVYVADILYIETFGRNTKIHTINTEIISYKNMKSHLSILGNNFYRCHRGFIINLAYVSGYENLTVSLKNGSEILLSRYKKNEFKKSLLEFYGQTICPFAIH